MTVAPAPTRPAPTPAAPREPRGGTRWRRTAIPLLPALAGLLALVLMTFNGVLPLNLAVSGQEFKLSSNGAPVQVPKGLTMYPSTIRMKNGGETRGVVIAGLTEATLTKGMCLSLVLTFPVAGSFTIRLHTDGETTVKDMTLDSNALKAGGGATLNPKTTDGKAGNGRNVLVPVTIGQDAGDDPINGPKGRFAINAPGNGTLSGLQADAQGAIIAGTLDVTGLSVEIHHGRGVANGECY